MLKVDQTERLASWGRGRSRLALLVLCIYWPGIFILSHIPKEHVPEDLEFSGLRLHLAAYLVLALLVFINAGMIRRISFRSRKLWLWVGVIAVYAAIDELLQECVEGRDGNIVDWAIDVLAVLACVGFLWLLDRLSSRPSSGRNAS